MKNKNLYISDLDGTLLRNNATISAYTKEKLIELLNDGLNFTVASARSIASLQGVLRGIPFRLPVIEINGAFITDFATEQHLVINELDKAVIEGVYRCILKHNCLPFVSAFNGSEDRFYYQKLINDGMRFYYEDRITNRDKRVEHVDNIKDTFGCNNIVALTVINTYEKVKPIDDEIHELFGDDLQRHFFENPYSPSWWWLTVHDKKACKSHAIQTLIDYAGFDKEHLVVFDDKLNDVRMFQSAKRAIAVQNASDEIKSYATEIIGSNEEDSVIKYIEKDMNAQIYP